MAEEADDLWIFGYGSLMWRPGFRHVERHRAQLHGYHRSLCIFSHVHRGTPDAPGLVLGLDRGGGRPRSGLRGAPPGGGAPTPSPRRSEPATAVYLERHVRVHLEYRRRIRALTFVADRRHIQYAGRLPEADLMRLVRQGVGLSGANPDYVRATHEQLIEMGVSDRILARIAQALA